MQVLANNQVVWSSPLGSNRLSLDSDLGIGQLKHPTSTLAAHVDSPTRRTELLFLPNDAQASFKSLTAANSNDPSVPAGLSAGFVHPGGTATYPVGTALVALNGLKPQSIRTLYQRKHGECELEVQWDSLFRMVLAQLNSTYGEDPDCRDFWCPNFFKVIDHRVATSYLRKRGVNGQGGFGVFFLGSTYFDSNYIDDLSFYGKVAYDVSLSDGSREVEQGLPEFTVSAGPHAGTWDCSWSPFTVCPEEEVEGAVKSGLSGAAGTLNDIIAECATAPLSANCETPEDCDGTPTAIALANNAHDEAIARGMSEARASEFRAQVRDPASWTCAPVKQTCADLFGAEPNPDRVCQMKLRATDVIAMPNSFSIVWYPGDPGQNPVTAAQALYLGLTRLGQSDVLAQLCSPVQPTRARAFVKRVDDSPH